MTKIISSTINTLLIVYLLLVNQHESFIASLLFMILAIFNSILIVYISKNEEIKKPFVQLILILLISSFLFYYLIQRYYEVSLMITKLGLIAYGLNIASGVTYYLYLNFGKRQK
ncbi:MAG: hypothetical protein JXR05_01150 [Flavobacteriaceae bacterium]